MLKRLLLQSIAVFAVAYFMPSVTVTPWYTAIIVAIVLGLINTFIRPVVKLVTLPINVITLGLFTLVINAVMVMLCDWVVPGFETTGFVSSFIFSIVLAVVAWILNLFFGGDD